MFHELLTSSVFIKIDIPSILKPELLWLKTLMKNILLHFRLNAQPSDQIPMQQTQSHYAQPSDQIPMQQTQYSYAQPSDQIPMQQTQPSYAQPSDQIPMQKMQTCET